MEDIRLGFAIWSQYDPLQSRRYVTREGRKHISGVMSLTWQGDDFSFTTHPLSVSYTRRPGACINSSERNRSLPETLDMIARPAPSIQAACIW